MAVVESVEVNVKVIHTKEIVVTMAIMFVRVATEMGKIVPETEISLMEFVVIVMAQANYVVWFVVQEALRDGMFVKDVKVMEYHSVTVVPLLEK